MSLDALLASVDVPKVSPKTDLPELATDDPKAKAETPVLAPAPNANAEGAALVDPAFVVDDELN